MVPARVLVEGRQDWQLLASLRAHLGYASTRLEIQEVGGESTFAGTIQAIPAERDFGRLEAVGVIVDGDAAAAAKLADAQRWWRPLADHGWPCPQGVNTVSGHRLRSGVFVAAGSGLVGSIESLLLGSVTDRARLACLDAYFQCVDSLPDPPPADYRRDKRRMQAFLAAQPTHHHGPGAAAGSARQGYAGCLWNWTHPAFVPLIAFLRALVGDAADGGRR